MAEQTQVAAHFQKGSDLVYAVRSSGYYQDGKRRRRMVTMHREIMKPPEGMVIDHINSNGINNRRCNMRTCTPAENLRAARPRAGTRSRFIGVFPRGNRWWAAITYQREQFYLGTFDDEVEAAKARDKKAVELFGEFARLNFPEHAAPGRTDSH